MLQQVPYCGSPPLPGDLLSRFNGDPMLICILALFCLLHIIVLLKKPLAVREHRRAYAISGWLMASAALLSPLCALSVALFSARVAQHMVLVLVAAPLIARGMPPGRAATESLRLWLSCVAFFVALWFWHMPNPYEATFTSDRVYWTMHVTLFGSSIFLWRELLGHSLKGSGQALAAGMLTFVHMGLLGAVLALAERPLFLWHLTTTQAWGLTPLQDQQLGGATMWVPGIALFLWTALRSMARLWESMDRARPA